MLRRGRASGRWVLFLGIALQAAALASACGRTRTEPGGYNAGGAGEAQGGTAGSVDGPLDAGASGNEDESRAGAAGSPTDSAGAGGAAEAGAAGAGAGEAGASGALEVLLHVVEIAAGEYHACALFSDGRVKCWGDVGKLGYGNVHRIGDDELPSSVGFVSITSKPGVRVKHLTLRGNHSCALLTDGTITCWGIGNYGQLGYGNKKSVGIDEVPSSVGSVQVSSDPRLTVSKVVAGTYSTCAILSDGSLKCWGFGEYGALGLGNDETIGDNETPASVPAIAMPGGFKVLEVAVGQNHICALLADHTVSCWGVWSGDGYGERVNSKVPRGPVILSKPPDVTVTHIDADEGRTCALFSNGTVTCWGSNANGELGRGNTLEIGDNELPSSLSGPISITSDASLGVTQLSAGRFSTCVLLSDASVKCWGGGYSGALGLGVKGNIGDLSLPSAFGAISVSNTPGVKVVQVAAGCGFTCALLSDHSVKCWGTGEFGALGQGNTKNIGDDELPSSVAPIRLLSSP